MELVAQSNHEPARSVENMNSEQKRVEMTVLPAIWGVAVVATVVLVPVALGRGYGTRIMNRVNDLTATKRIKDVISPLFDVEEPTLRRSQILRNKNRFVANPDAVSVIEDDFNPVSYSDIPIEHTPQEGLLG